MIKYYKENSSTALKHQIGSLLSVFFQEKNILKFLKLKDESIFVKDFFISTKFEPKRIEHLQEKGIIWSELYFRNRNSQSEKNSTHCGLLLRAERQV